MKLEVENKKRLVVDVNEELYTDLDLLAGGLSSVRNMMIIALIKDELKKREDIIEKLKEVERTKQAHLDKLGKYFEQGG